MTSDAMVRLKLSCLFLCVIGFSIVTLLCLYLPDKQIAYNIGRLSAFNASILPSSHSVQLFHTKKNEEVVIAAVICGNRTSQALVMIKSAIVFRGNSDLRIVVIAEKNIQQEFDETLRYWRLLTNDSFSYEIHSIIFPKEHSDEWRKLFQPCASERLFLPTVLNHLDSILYVDTDTLFLSSVEDVWKHFSQMNSSQLAAMVPEHEDMNVGWYNRFANHPYYGKLGLNSGVMLMNLTRMREFDWISRLAPVLEKYRLYLTWGDQDIINVIFHDHPDKVYVYPCRYNYRSDHCMYMSNCKSAEEDGVAVLHGSRSTFQTNKQPAFRALFNAMSQYQLGSDPVKYLLEASASLLNETTSTNCGRLAPIFTHNMRLMFQTV
ncbi:glucoside xylosyltransferase 1 [Acyrthosiphon pisum]|uniref:UDP-D-xylose:beta-D-glucoside alpha-1,3-D-xylosyltransferase n=1 Tax=Acyrthosiphon pisum TaxID=7029 RepID=A0A8R1VYP9_ACYPI|nr:glucoside xylosyltransferase 1 [Acyrthosiphon pisum]|eukprot:XP_001943688.2 PREDICTED: glucoside xylosyltransferase 1 [Acyrthosiphon pisum]